MVRLSGNASTVLPAMSVTVGSGSIVFVGQVIIISLFVIFFHCSINNSHVFWYNQGRSKLIEGPWYNRINFINFHYVFVAGELAVEAYSCIQTHACFSFVCLFLYYRTFMSIILFLQAIGLFSISDKLTYLFFIYSI